MPTATPFGEGNDSGNSALAALCKPSLSSIHLLPFGGSMKIQRLEDVTTWPEFREFTAEEMKEAYALARAAFTADDLQKYTELDEGVPFEEVLEELETILKEKDKAQP
jgi:hypothetical protein